MSACQNVIVIAYRSLTLTQIVLIDASCCVGETGDGRQALRSSDMKFMQCSFLLYREGFDVGRINAVYKFNR